MDTLRSEEDLRAWAQANPAALLLFGGAHCSVCEAIKPKLQRMLDEEFPSMRLGYAQCDGDARALCASQGLFAIPVIWLYFEGKRAGTFVRVFSLQEVRAAIERPYALLFG